MTIDDSFHITDFVEGILMKAFPSFLALALTLFSPMFSTPSSIFWTNCTTDNENIADLVIGHSLPEIIGGRLFIGGFSGSKVMGKNHQGFMAGVERSFCPSKDANGNNYMSWVFLADFASGKNTIGGGGFSMKYNFSPKASLQTGPVWFNDHKINGKWKWSIQLDIYFP